jgi:hypothetical protein
VDSKDLENVYNHIEESKNYDFFGEGACYPIGEVTTEIERLYSSQNFKLYDAPIVDSSPSMVKHFNQNL